MFRLNLLSRAIEKLPNRYFLVHMLAKRIHQIEEGAQPLSGEKFNSNFNKVLEEIVEGKIKIEEMTEAAPEKLESETEQ